MLKDSPRINKDNFELTLLKDPLRIDKVNFQLTITRKVPRELTESTFNLASMDGFFFLNLTNKTCN